MYLDTSAMTVRPAKFGCDELRYSIELAEVADRLLDRLGTTFFCSEIC